MRFALYDLILGDSRIASNSILINQTLHHRGSRLWQNDRRSTTVSPWWRRFCGTSVDVPRGATWVTWAAGLGRRGSEDEVQREVETCRAECIIVGEVWGMGGTVLCGIRQLNILEWLGTHSRLFEVACWGFGWKPSVLLLERRQIQTWTLHHLGWGDF